MKDSRKTALVLGATGGIGGEVAMKLIGRGWKVKALTRNLKSPRVLLHPDFEWFKGDSINASDVAKVAIGADVIVHAVNPPGYRDWEKVVLPMLDNSIAAAEESGARLLLPNGFYNYGVTAPDLIDENTPQVVSSRKGKIRKEMEEKLVAMVSRGKAKALVVRAGDFFGPRPGGNWFSQAMVQPGKPVSFIALPGKKGVGHTWAYLPDLAEAMVRLLEKESELKAYEGLQFGGHFDEDGKQMAEAIKEYYPNKKISQFHFPWLLVRAVAPFSNLASEMLDVSYLWKRAYRFDNSRLVKLIGEEPHTPMREAVATALAGLKC
jgi:nucleoside-diphosphate-sugar epimerase